MKHEHDFRIAVDDLPTIETLAQPARFSLRVREAGVGAVGAALGLDLPRRVGDRAMAGDREVLCLGPDEWVVVAPEADGPAIRAALDAIYAETPHAAADISDREITLRVTGAGALTLLAMGCPRDVGAVEPGRAVRTVFHGATVILWRDGPDAVRIDVWRSFAPHVRALMETGQKELAAGL